MPSLTWIDLTNQLVDWSGLLMVDGRHATN
jgi:hypothetical protein